jgi:hypothetical protein
MDASALYYTFSTIAQTLAAGFAVLAAFVLFRLQGIETELNRAKAAFAAFPDYFKPNEAWDILTTKGLDAFGQTLSKIEEEKHVAVVGFRALVGPSEQVVRWWPIWQKTVRLLRWSLCFTVADIGMCLIAIPIVPQMASSLSLSSVAAAVTVLVAIAAIGLYSKLILLLLTPTPLAPEALQNESHAR